MYKWKPCLHADGSIACPHAVIVSARRGRTWRITCSILKQQLAVQPEEMPDGCPRIKALATSCLYKNVGKACASLICNDLANYGPDVAIWIDCGHRKKTRRYYVKRGQRPKQCPLIKGACA